MVPAGIFAGAYRRHGAAIPRTAFTLAAGLLFGSVVGVFIAVVGSTASAVIAMLLVRATGWQLNSLVRRRAINRLDERLRERGWLAILSLRLIPVVPFAAISYAAGASGVRILSFAWATLAGLLPAPRRWSSWATRSPVAVARC